MEISLVAPIPGARVAGIAQARFDGRPLMHCIDFDAFTPRRKHRTAIGDI